MLRSFAEGNFASGVFVSCRQSTSGLAISLHLITWSSRDEMPLMFQVAIFTFTCPTSQPGILHARAPVDEYGELYNLTTGSSTTQAKIRSDTKLCLRVRYSHLV